MYRLKEDICEDIKKDDIVEVISLYGYMIGTDERIKDYFKVKTDEVVVKKIVANELKGKQTFSFAKCKRTMLKEI